MREQEEEIEAQKRAVEDLIAEERRKADAAAAEQARIAREKADKDAEAKRLADEAAAKKKAADEANAARQVAEREAAEDAALKAATAAEAARKLEQAKQEAKLEEEARKASGRGRRRRLSPTPARAKWPNWRNSARLRRSMRSRRFGPTPPARRFLSPLIGRSGRSLRRRRSFAPMIKRPSLEFDPRNVEAMKAALETLKCPAVRDTASAQIAKLVDQNLRTQKACADEREQLASINLSVPDARNRLAALPQNPACQGLAADIRSAIGLVDKGVADAQDQLNRLGCYKSRPSGRFDAATIAAIADYLKGRSAPPDAPKITDAFVDELRQQDFVVCDASPRPSVDVAEARHSPARRSVDSRRAIRATGGYDLRSS